MNDPRNDAAPLKETPAGSRLTALEGALDADLERHGALLKLLAGDVDALIGALCAGHPLDLASECRDHVADNAYFIEEDRVAAKAIARLASLAGAPRATAVNAIEGLIADATAAILEEGPLEEPGASIRDDPLDDNPPLLVQLARRLGVSIELVRRLVPRLNALEFEDRHVVYHCLVGRMSPRDYAERFDDDPRIVQAMLEQVAKLAIGG